KQRIQWKHPIVGLHVRRTDKLLKEAKYHSMDEYIKYVDRYYDNLDTTSGKTTRNRLVYLATDEPNCNNYRQRVGFKHPIVGIHVRRTDKLIREAKYHSLDQYMSYVDRYYNNTDVMNGNTSERLVYLATDEPNVWLNEIKPYIGKGFIFKGDMKATMKSYNKNRDKMFSARFMDNVEVYNTDKMVPAQIKTQLHSLSTEPFALFVGLLIQYLMRPTLELSRYYDNYKQRIQWKHPIVGLHVRRTDKLLKEAKYHSMDEYIKYVDRYYDNLDTTSGKTTLNRLVYLATDEPNIKCGFGCTMHHYTYCLILALKLNRTLIIPETITNTYTSHMKMLFRPISDTCLDSNGDNSTTWEGMSDQTHYYYQVIDFYFGYNSKGYLQDLKNLTQIIRQLQSLSTEPIPLFIGHIIRYLMRPTLELSRYYDNYKQRIQWKHPIVGLHVRRTDKLLEEAKYHSMDEYIKYVDRYYDSLDTTSGNKSHKRLVYLATDEPNVWLKELSPYIERRIEFIGDQHISREAFAQMSVDWGLS
ncbi:unnamed protein product, partial [Oppiella nova]